MSFLMKSVFFANRAVLRHRAGAFVSR